MQETLSWYHQISQAQPLPELTPAKINGLSGEGQMLAQTVLMLRGSAPSLPLSQARLVHSWVQSWASYLLRQQKWPADQVINWLELSELQDLTRYRLSLEFLAVDPNLARQLAQSIHPLSKRESCLAQLELALHDRDEAALARALQAADAPPQVSTGGEECQALGEALVRLSHTSYHPDHPAIQAAYSRLLKLAQTRVEKDARSYEILPIVKQLLQAERPQWRDLAPALIEQLHTPSLRAEAEKPPLQASPSPEFNLDEELPKLEGLPAFERWMALRRLGSQLSLEQLVEQIRRISEDRSRHRCASELAAHWLDQDQLQAALQLLEVALLCAPEVSLWKSHQVRDLECQLWLRLNSPERVKARLESELAVDAAALRWLRLAAAGPLSPAHLQALGKQPESHFYSGDPPSDECLGASLAHLIPASKESWAAALFTGQSDPQRKALGAFLRERIQLRGEFCWENWGERLKLRNRSCAVVGKIMAPWLAQDARAQEYLDGLQGGDTNRQEALFELARERARQGNSLGCWELAERLNPYPLSQLCESLQGIEPTLKLLEVLQQIPRTGLDNVEKEILDRRVAQMELACGQPKKAWKALPKLGKHNPVAALHLAQSLLEWLHVNPSEVQPERVELLWKALLLGDAVVLAKWLPILLPKLLALTPVRLDFAYALGERLGAGPDQSLLWLSLPASDEHLSRALEQAEKTPTRSALLEPSLRAALAHPQLNLAQKARFLRRLSPVHPRNALEVLEQLLSEPELPTRQILALALPDQPFPAELQAKATLAWAVAVLRHSPQPQEEWRQLLSWSPPPAPALARDLLEVARLIQESSG